MVHVRVLSLFGLPAKTELFVPSAEALSSFSVARLPFVPFAKFSF